MGFRCLPAWQGLLSCHELQSPSGRREADPGRREVAWHPGGPEALPPLFCLRGDPPAAHPWLQSCVVVAPGGASLGVEGVTRGGGQGGVPVLLQAAVCTSSPSPHRPGCVLGGWVPQGPSVRLLCWGVGPGLLSTGASVWLSLWASCISGEQGCHELVQTTRRLMSYRGRAAPPPPSAAAPNAQGH